MNQALPFDRLPQASAPAAATQWDTQQRDAGHYDLGSYLPTGGEPRGYGPADAPPFAGSADGPFRHQYAARDGYSNRTATMRRWVRKRPRNRGADGAGW